MDVLTQHFFSRVLRISLILLQDMHRVCVLLLIPSYILEGNDIPLLPVSKQHMDHMAPR